MEVYGYVNAKRELSYSCPICLRTHTHGWVVGNETEHRVSHCPVDDRSVLIKVSNFQEAMEAEKSRRKETNAIHSLNYYHKHKDEVQKTKLIRRMEKGYRPKVSTLAKYQIPQAEFAETKVA